MPCESRLRSQQYEDLCCKLAGAKVQKGVRRFD